MRSARLESEDVSFMQAYAAYAAIEDEHEVETDEPKKPDFVESKRKVSRWLTILEDRIARKQLDLTGQPEERKLTYDQDTMKRTDLPETKRRYRDVNHQLDRRYWKRTFLETRYDLLERQCFTAAMETLKYLQFEIDERNSVFQKSIDQQNLLQAHNTMISIESYIGSSTNFLLDKGIIKLRNEILDTNILNQIGIRMINKHEGSRKEQHNLKLSQTEKALGDSTKNNKQKMKIDTRIHSEISEYLRTQINDYQTQVKDWSEKYDSEIEEIDTRIIMKKESLDLIEKELAQLKAIYDERQLKIEEYLEIKHGKEMFNKKVRMSLALQSWWRGLVFRQNLMPKRGKRKGKPKK
ncbi:dynein regulatory complex protein 9-like [Ctenocephalides felis]|uniref:dynein regulatory complex protein 9-like n=1 Tax=Ctenocephalides felis TaxID=7515 RepID=UPI000E6E5ABB|nr:dynein regulatory complex protein 9-like [Ctenocephalides felis]